MADSVSLRITCNVAPEGDCTYQPSGLCQPSGALNLALLSSYYATLKLQNGLKPRNSDVPPQSEPNGIQIYELEVEISNSSGSKISFGSGVPNPYTVPASGFIEPGEDGLVGASLIPVAYVRRLIDMNPNVGSVPNQIRLVVLARGRTSGDVEVETGDWNWAIELYKRNPTYGGGECVTSEEDVCTLGQDSSAFTCDPSTVPE